MSDNYLILIPDNPNYMPDVDQGRAAFELFRSFLSLADELKFQATDNVTFVDQGGNFERVLCPVCDTELTFRQWQHLMDLAYVTGFTDLSVVMPCCGAKHSLNELTYEWSAGFTRFRLEAKNPRVDLSADQIKAIGEKCGCHLRKIWRRV